MLTYEPRGEDLCLCLFLCTGNLDWPGLDWNDAVGLLVLSGYPGYSCSVGQEGKHEYLTLSTFFWILISVQPYQGYWG